MSFQIYLHFLLSKKDTLRLQSSIMENYTPGKITQKKTEMSTLIPNNVDSKEGKRSVCVCMCVCVCVCVCVKV
jgi:hypothetical protein